MIFGKIWNQVLVAIAASPVVIGSLIIQSAQATWLESLYAGQSAWVPVTLAEGNHTIDASTLWSLGDVDIELYDFSRRTLLVESNELGNELMNITVRHGGTFYIKYSMPLCINPLGACAVNIDIY